MHPAGVGTNVQAQPGCVSLSGYPVNRTSVRPGEIIALFCHVNGSSLSWLYGTASQLMPILIHTFTQSDSNPSVFSREITIVETRYKVVAISQRPDTEHDIVNSDITIIPIDNFEFMLESGVIFEVICHPNGEIERNCTETYTVSESMEPNATTCSCPGKNRTQ